MKRLFLLLLATVSLIACDKGGDNTPKPIELTGGTQTTQTVYADETQKSDGIKFNATAPWAATVSGVAMRSGSDVEWLTLSAYEGKAGEQTLTLTLLPNTTGLDRKAEIKITCGGTTITIIVEQKATNRDEDPDKPKPDIRYVKKAISKYPNGETVMAFEYDNQMRITKIFRKSSDTYNGVTEKGEGNIYFTYKDNTISLKLREVKNGIEQVAEDMVDITLNPNGTVNQAIVIGTHMEESEQGRPESVMFSYITRSAASKAPIITKFRLILDYTYDAQGYVTKVVESEETNGVITKNEGCAVSWSDSNLSKVEIMSDGKKASEEFKYSNIENKPCNWDMGIQSGEWSSSMFNVVGQLGLMGEKSKNLPSSLTITDDSHSYGKEYTYTLDKGGYVVSITEKGVGGSIYNATTTIEYVK